MSLSISSSAPLKLRVIGGNSREFTRNGCSVVYPALRLLPTLTNAANWLGTCVGLCRICGGRRWWALPSYRCSLCPNTYPLTPCREVFPTTSDPTHSPRLFLPSFQVVVFFVHTFEQLPGGCSRCHSATGPPDRRRRRLQRRIVVRCRSLIVSRPPRLELSSPGSRGRLTSSRDKLPPLPCPFHLPFPSTAHSLFQGSLSQTAGFTAGSRAPPSLSCGLAPPSEASDSRRRLKLSNWSISSPTPPSFLPSFT